MDSNNLAQIIINFSQTIGPLQHFFSGLSYVLGIVFIYVAITKFHAIGGAGRHSGGGGNTFVPIAYLVGGSILLFLPTSIHVFSNTVFGSGSVLQYEALNPIDVTSAMILVIQTAGLIWFIRGCALLVAASEPGVQEGKKGMVFLFAGILAMNFKASAAVINTLLIELADFTLSLKNGFGF